MRSTTGGKPDGFAVLLDTCYSGIAVREAASKWVQDLTDRSRFELMTAAGDRPVYAGCFTKALTALLRDGMAHVPVFLIDRGSINQGTLQQAA